MADSTVTEPAPATEGTRSWPVPEERRTVSVLFVDVVGSTGLVDQLDPEDVRGLQQEYFAAVSTVLRRWNGVVEKYVGDAVMALFGAVESDGYDAYRAVRAGLEIQRVLDGRTLAGTTLVRLRVGVATGEAVVDLAAAHDGGHGAISGAVVTLAARLQEHAPTGAVIVCAATRRATADLIDYQDLPPATMAGKPTPVPVWRAVGVTDVPAPDHDLPLIGRRRELAALHDQVALAVRGRTPRWVSVVGPDGVGRSRLLAELHQTVRRIDGIPVRWCRTQCPPYPDDPTTPLAALLRDLVGLGPGDAPETVRRRLWATCAPLVAPAHPAATVHALGALLTGHGDVGSGIRHGRELLLALADRQPLVVIVDDVDQAAGEVGRFLHGLFGPAAERALPLVVMVAHRPGWALLPPAAANRHHRLALPPLGAVDTGRLLRHLLGDRAPVARLLPLVAGNPGYARAYAAQAGDGTTVPPPVPEEVRRRLDARLDRLDGTARAVVMAGAAIGAGFTVEQVATLLGLTVAPLRPVLRDLVARGVLVWRPSRHGYEVADRVLAQVAYERLPRAVRAEFRRRISAGREDLPRTVRLVGAGPRPVPPGRIAPVAAPDPVSTERAARPCTAPPVEVALPLAVGA